MVVECIDSMGEGKHIDARLDLGGIMRNRQYIEKYQVWSELKDVQNTNNVEILNTLIKSNALKTDICVYSSLQIASKKNCSSIINLYIYNNTIDRLTFNGIVGIYEGKKINFGEFSYLLEEQGEFNVILSINTTELANLVNNTSYCKWSLHL